MELTIKSRLHDLLSNNCILKEDYNFLNHVVANLESCVDCVKFINLTLSQEMYHNCDQFYLQFVTQHIILQKILYHFLKNIPLVSLLCGIHFHFVVKYENKVCLYTWQTLIFGHLKQ